MKRLFATATLVWVRLAVTVSLVTLIAAQVPQQPAQNANGADSTESVEDLIKESLPEEMANWLHQVENRNGRIRLKTNFPYMTDTGYKNYMNALCKIVLENTIRFRGINDFSVTNRIGRQGYIYQTPQNCSKVVENHEKDPAEYDIFTDTRFCSRDC